VGGGKGPQDVTGLAEALYARFMASNWISTGQPAAGFSESEGGKAQNASRVLFVDAATHAAPLRLVTASASHGGKTRGGGGLRGVEYRSAVNSCADAVGRVAV